MTFRCISRRFVGLVFLFGLALSGSAADHSGEVRFGEVPVPGVIVTAMRGEETVRARTDIDGRYRFPELDNGVWKFRLELIGFQPLTRELTVASISPPAIWNLSMLPLAEIDTEPAVGFVDGPPAMSLPEELPPANALDAPDSLAASGAVTAVSTGLLINGSVNNGAETPFAQPLAFGNNRPPAPPVYRGNVNVATNNSAFDARPFSVTGREIPQAAHSRTNASIEFGGPLRIPGVIRNGPRFTLSYSRMQNREVHLEAARVPRQAERSGDFGASSTLVRDPVTGLPFVGNVLPESRIRPEARALVELFPLPNVATGGPYNYQALLTGSTHGDSVRIQLNDVIGANNWSAGLDFDSRRADETNLFGFVARRRTSATDANLAWSRRIGANLTASVRYAFSLGSARLMPFFAERRNVSAEAGIYGNDPDPRNWGPPNLTFSGGVVSLSDAQYAFDRTMTHEIAYSSSWRRNTHLLRFGVDIRRRQFNLFSQEDARGTFTFTGTATGDDFADFLLGIPAASAIAFGNADKYFRQSFIDAFVVDDWRVTPSLTLNLGVRWEYEAAITELYGRLVNLDVAPGFEAVAPVLASMPNGSLTGRDYPESLIQPDTGGIEPRVGVAWRPFPAASLVVRAGYGVYRDTNVYRSIAGQMAQQAPLSTSLRIQNTPEHPLTLADGFREAGDTAKTTTFAVDPGFRVGESRNWNLAIQHDLPTDMQMTLTYLGVSGMHLPRRLLPNTFPSGAENPCPACPAGFVYLTSNGRSGRHAGTIELRRRPRNGFQASVSYTLSKAIDDAGLGGNHIVQNWRDLQSERALSSFDQRHHVTVEAAYTTGFLAGIGSLWNGWRRALFREWTLSAQLTAGSGRPLTPIILTPVSGTGVTGSLRPDRTGEPLYLETADRVPNPAAFRQPEPGTWGDAGRNSITGPMQLSLDASLTRTFRVGDRVSMDLRVDVANVLNHATFPEWNMLAGGSQFGRAERANAMRTIRPSLRVRF